jgi:hypothetical protein
VTVPRSAHDIMFPGLALQNTTPVPLVDMAEELNKEQEREKQDLQQKKILSVMEAVEFHQEEREWREAEVENGREPEVAAGVSDFRDSSQLLIPDPFQVSITRGT